MQAEAKPAVVEAVTCCSNGENAKTSFSISMCFTWSAGRRTKRKAMCNVSGERDKKDKKGERKETRKKENNRASEQPDVCRREDARAV